MTEPAPPPSPPTPEQWQSSDWILWRGDRQFGPMTGLELEGYFVSKMALASDAVSGPGWSERVPAPDAANLLSLPAPGVIAMADAPRPVLPAPMKVHAVSDEPPRSSPLIIVLWLAALMALQIRLSLHEAFVSHAAAPYAWGQAAVVFALIAMVCFGFFFTVGKRLQSRVSNGIGSLFAMTMIYGVLFVRSSLGLHAMPAPAENPAQPAAEFAQQASSPDSASEQDELWNSEPGTEAAAALAPSAPSSPGAGRPITTFQIKSRAPAPVAEGVPQAARRDWIRLAQQLQIQRDWSGLVALTDQWMAESPEDAHPWVFRSLAHNGLGQYNIALDERKRALQIAPDAAYIWAGLSNTYMLLNDPINAEQAARKAIDLDEHEAMGWNNLGVVLNVTGRYDEAAAAFERTVAESPSSASGWHNLGDVYARQGNWAEARDAYQAAMRNDPTDPRLAAAFANADRMQKMLNP